MRTLWIFGVTAWVSMASGETARAVADNEPYLAVRTGLRCSDCHTNRTGGGKRTDFGVVYAQTRLPMTVIPGPGVDGPFLSSQIAEFLALGSDVRVRSSRQFSGTDPKNPIEFSEANLYVEARVIPDRLAVYVDETVAPGSARSRELFVLLSGLPGAGYLKAGRFFLPYGLRLLDDAEYIRQRTGFNFANSDEGIELGLEPGPLSLVVAVTNGTQGGTETNSDKQISAVGSVVWRWARLGASVSRNDAASGRRDVVGAFGGLRLGRLAFLGEADWIYDDPPEGRPGDQFVAFLEGNLLVTRGLNLKVTYGYLDPDRSIGENARIRLRFGVEPILTQFLQASLFYTLLEDIPQARTDRDQVSLELHAFF